LEAPVQDNQVQNDVIPPNAIMVWSALKLNDP
jgi:hypothetical protein